MVSFSKKEIYTADTGMYRLKKEAIFCVKSDMQEDSKTVEKKTEKSSSDVMVHGRLFVFLYCRCINSYLNKTEKKIAFQIFFVFNEVIPEVFLY